MYCESLTKDFRSTVLLDYLLQKQYQKVLQKYQRGTAEVLLKYCRCMTKYQKALGRKKFNDLFLGKPKPPCPQEFGGVQCESLRKDLRSTRKHQVGKSSVTSSLVNQNPLAPKNLEVCTVRVLQRTSEVLCCWSTYCRGSTRKYCRSTREVLQKYC